MLESRREWGYFWVVYLDMYYYGGYSLSLDKI
jgi:hypothetical protein